MRSVVLVSWARPAAIWSTNSVCRAKAAGEEMLMLSRHCNTTRFAVNGGG